MRQGSTLVKCQWLQVIEGECVVEDVKRTCIKNRYSRNFFIETAMTSS